MELMDKVAEGKFEELKSSWNNDSTMDECNYLFHVACENGRLEIAKWLLELKPDINMFVPDDFDDVDGTFVAASDNGHFETVKWLIETAKKPPLDSMFTAAFESKHYDIAKYVYKKSPDSIDLGKYSKEQLIEITKFMNN